MRDRLVFFAGEGGSEGAGNEGVGLHAFDKEDDAFVGKEFQV